MIDPADFLPIDIIPDSTLAHRCSLAQGVTSFYGPLPATPFG
ncbi:hypothetical protein [Paenibacillus macerans]|nr:hypothetical protein [Paenibacillus macerans]MEC0153968.1 hypothetical protein [Paenibacillus macerans]